LIAHEVIKFAKEKGKAIAIEDKKNSQKEREGTEKQNSEKSYNFSLIEEY
jgi:predicted neuraminidase